MEQSYTLLLALYKLNLIGCKVYVFCDFAIFSPFALSTFFYTIHFVSRVVRKHIVYTFLYTFPRLCQFSRGCARLCWQVQLFGFGKQNPSTYKRNFSVSPPLIFALTLCIFTACNVALAVTPPHTETLLKMAFFPL